MFTENEISTILQESRKDREVDRLFKILERVTELKDTEISKAKSLADIHIPKLSAELQVAESIADTLLEKRLKAETEISFQLEKKRQDRTIEWDKFVHDMTNKCIRIDNTFKDKEEEVRELYKKAEEKLIEQHQSQVTESLTNFSIPPTSGSISSAVSSSHGEKRDTSNPN